MKKKGKVILYIKNIKDKKGKHVKTILNFVDDEAIIKNVISSCAIEGIIIDPKVLEE